MNCREATDFLSDYLAGELPAPTLEAFQVHLKKCGNCGTFLAQYEATIRAGKRACAEEASDARTELPDDLLNAIVQALKADAKSS